MTSMMPTVGIEVDTSTIQLAISLARKSTTRKLDLLLGSTAYHVAWKAAKYMPFVAVGTIDAELDEVVQVTNKHPKWNGKTEMRTDPLPWTRGMMIAIMRTQPNSKYSIATDNRWPVAPFPGGGRNDAAWNYFKDVAERQKRSRHSSTHFLAAGWKSVKQQLKAMNFKIGASSMFMESDGSENALNDLSVSGFGSATAGGQGTMEQWIKIENDIGMSGRYPNLDQERNEAMITYGTPSLERALGEQSEEMRDHYLPSVGEELAAEWYAVPDAKPYVKGVRTSKLRAIESMAGVGQDLEAF